ncbi:MAG: AsmA-like C-terminal domain-containing protein [Alphaproteobacteria bacterium]|nr:AsmA-like C-terminal domain-containing protein [Alphaproteobacteria bacterium]
MRTAQVAVDLTPATISLEPISYRKPPGVPASAQISARIDPKGAISAADLNVSGAGLTAQGTLSFNNAGDLARAEIPTLRAGPANDFALTLTQVGANGTDIFVRGHSADGTAFNRRDTNSGNAPPSSARYHVVAKIDRMVLKEGTVLAPFSLDATTIGGRITNLSLTTGMSKADSLTASITPASDGRRLSVNATDAGALLRGVFGLSDISGGRLSVVARMPPVTAAKGAPDYIGTLNIRDFKIENQPFFSRLFSAGSLGGLLDLMRGSGIVIDKLDMPFSMKNGAITIHDAHAAGPSVGLSADGYIDQRSNSLDLKGAVAPIYGLNSVLGALPLVGKVLVSKEGEGILGMTYEANGSLDEPKISVNPLSMLAPGIFRRIFEGKMPTAPEQADKTPPPASTPH